MKIRVNGIYVYKQKSYSQEDMQRGYDMLKALSAIHQFTRVSDWEGTSREYWSNFNSNQIKQLLFIASEQPFLEDVVSKLGQNSTVIEEFILESSSALRP